MLSALDLRGNSRVNLRYGGNFDLDTYKLLEVDERLLKELLEDGLSIKGAKDDEAVLCTSKATYAMKFVSTSNTVLLVPPKLLRNSARDSVSEDAPVTGLKTDTAAEVSVAAAAAGHIELVEISPRLENLKALLSQRLYNEDIDDQADAEDSEGLYTLDDLLARVQASESQLRAALRTLQAVEINGFWRLPDEGFMHRLLEMLLVNAIQHDWRLDAIPGLEAIKVLGADSYSPPIVIHCLTTFGVRTDSLVHENPSLISQGEDVTDWTGVETRWSLDESRVCLQYGKRLLASNPNWKLEDFLDSWRRVVPAGMNPRLEMLGGEALVDVVGPESRLHHFTISSLPRRPEARFAALFKRRAKWQWEDLEPYLRDLKEPNQSVEAMLLKYTRTTQPSANVPPIYTIR